MTTCQFCNDNQPVLITMNGVGKCLKCSQSELRGYNPQAEFSRAVNGMRKAKFSVPRTQEILDILKDVK